MFAVVIVACLLVLGMRYADASGSFGDRVGEVLGGDSGAQGGSTQDDPRTRELVLSQANQFMIRINTYGPSDLDKQDKMPGYVQRVREVITPKLDVDFEKQVTLAEQSVAQAGLARSIQLYASGLESLDTDIATVLVTGAISQSYPDPVKDGRIEYEPLVFRYEVRLVKTDGTWLVDDFSPVKGEVAGEPTDAVPSDVPTDPATVDPSSGAQSGAGSDVVQRYGQIVAKRAVSISDAVTTLDTCGFPAAADAGDATCAGAPDALASAVRTLNNSLAGAANPDSRVFVGTPPAAISDLVRATQDAADSVLAASAILDPSCVSGTTSRCAAQRKALVSAVDNLVTGLSGWESIS
ncbi:hypothetical protein [Nocardioides rubriscoriae]|uniref:hypothetical protein n=1 Tax=Nocardioides rubriscoriae TaxID=642762 RepID=UPI001B864E10|nr:hypothetical protein [Nocardioides rubriscoriae]